MACRLSRWNPFTLRWPVLLALTLLISPSWAVEPLRLSPGITELQLGPHLELIADPDAKLRMADVAAGLHSEHAIRSTRKVPNLGYVSHPYWVRMQLANISNDSLHRLLLLYRGTKHDQYIRIDGPAQQRELRIGGNQLLGDLISRHAVVQLELPAHSLTTITIRLQSRTGLSADYRLLNETALLESEVFETWMYGMLFGIASAIGFYVLMLFLATRERLYLWFAGLALGGVLYQLHFEGFAFVAAWRGWQWGGNFALILSGIVQVLCTVAFVRDYLETPRTLRWCDRWLIRPSIVPLVLSLPLFPYYWWVANWFASIGSIYAVLTMAATLTWAWHKGLLQNRVMPLAFVLYWLAASLFLLKQSSLLPDLALFNLLFPLTFAIALLLFALAVSARFRRLAEERRRVLERDARQLEGIVRERTTELLEAKERAESALEQLKLAQQELVNAEKMASLGQLVAGVAHEINTPIGVAITANSYLCDRSGQTHQHFDAGNMTRSELQTFLCDCETSTSMVATNLERAARLITTFKQVSADRSGDTRRRFDLAVYLDDLAESLRPSWKQRDVSFEVDCPRGIELDSYPGTLGQVVGELAHNALLHGISDKPGGWMRLSARKVDDNHVDIDFEDNGPGADPTILGRMFEPFYTTRRGQGGTGLGLHITFNLVNTRLGGRIKAENRPGGGLRFRLHIPRIAPLPVEDTKLSA